MNNQLEDYNEYCEDNVFEALSYLDNGGILHFDGLDLSKISIIDVKDEDESYEDICESFVRMYFDHYGQPNNWSEVTLSKLRQIRNNRRLRNV